MRQSKIKTLSSKCELTADWCDLPTYPDEPVSKLFLRGWFNDQKACCNLLLENLTPADTNLLFDSGAHLESVKKTYLDLWPRMKEIADSTPGVHKLPDQLYYTKYFYWAKCVFNEVKKYGPLENLLSELATVERAHEVFKPWFKVKRRVRGLNAADAARLLARHGHLAPESRPLLARGALRGAAIIVDHRDLSKKVPYFENELYSDEKSRTALEVRAAQYIKENFPNWSMEQGENWFCEQQKHI